MRETNDISEEEFDKYNKRFIDLTKEPYIKALRVMKTELHLSPDTHEWKEVDGKSIWSLKEQYQAEWDDLDNDMEKFRKVKYPDLMFDLENDEKHNRINELFQDSEYDNLIKGITYHSGEVHSDQDALNKIDGLMEQIEDLIDTKYPDLFDMTNLL